MAYIRRAVMLALGVGLLAGCVPLQETTAMPAVSQIATSDAATMQAALLMLASQLAHVPNLTTDQIQLAQDEIAIAVAAANRIAAAESTAVAVPPAHDLETTVGKIVDIVAAATLPPPLPLVVQGLVALAPTILNDLGIKFLPHTKSTLTASEARVVLKGFAK